MTGWLLFCTPYPTEVLQKLCQEATPFRSDRESHPGKWMNVPMLASSLGGRGSKSHRLMQGLLRNTPNQVHPCAFMVTSILKIQFIFSLFSALKHSGTCTWQSVLNTHVLLLWRWQSHREGRRPGRRQRRHVIMWLDMDTSIFFIYLNKTIYKRAPR